MRAKNARMVPKNNRKYELELFGRTKSVISISRHINSIFKEGELEEKRVVAKNATTGSKALLV